VSVLPTTIYVSVDTENIVNMKIFLYADLGISNQKPLLTVEKENIRSEKRKTATKLLRTNDSKQGVTRTRRN